MVIGVVGAGTMGAGIAQTFAAAGEEVVLTDATVELANGGRKRIAADLDHQVGKGRIDRDAADSLLRGIRTDVVESLGTCDLVLEAITEKVGAKREIFTRLDGMCPEGTVLASNTSSLSLTEISRGLSRPVVGMHFFNPAPVMKLVEVIAGATTSDELVERVATIAGRIGKTPVRVRESAGFVVNRILIPMINEAIGVVAEGTASVDDVDTAMKLGANHPIGPLALGDLVGLDVVLAIMETLQAETGDPKYRPHPLLRTYVRAGWLGRKTGRGFHVYDGK